MNFHPKIILFQMQAISLAVCVCVTNASNMSNSRSPRHSLNVSLTSVTLASTTVPLEHALVSQSEWWALQANTNEMSANTTYNDPNSLLTVAGQSQCFFHKVPSMDYICKFFTPTLFRALIKCFFFDCFLPFLLLFACFNIFSSFCFSILQKQCPIACTQAKCKATLTCHALLQEVDATLTEVTVECK